MNIGLRQMKFQSSIKQFSYFFIAGISAVFFDFLSYTLTIEFLGRILSKIIGFYSGVLVSFLINSSLTFRKTGKRFFSKTYFFRYIILLSINMFINVCINYFLLKYFYNLNNITLIAFYTATFFSMIFNFVGMKLVVFK